MPAAVVRRFCDTATTPLQDHLTENEGWDVSHLFPSGCQGTVLSACPPHCQSGCEPTGTEGTQQRFT